MKHSSSSRLGQLPPSHRPNSRDFGSELFIPRSILIPPDPPLKRSQIAQALIDGIAVVFGFFFLAALVGCIPLAILLLVFAG